MAQNSGPDPEKWIKLHRYATTELGFGQRKATVRGGRPRARREGDHPTSGIGVGEHPEPTEVDVRCSSLHLPWTKMRQVCLPTN
jgi:hypothetical protein